MERVLQSLMIVDLYGMAPWKTGSIPYTTSSGLLPLGCQYPTKITFSMYYSISAHSSKLLQTWYDVCRRNTQSDAILLIISQSIDNMSKSLTFW